MTTNIPKWTEERTTTLSELAGSGVVSKALVDEIAVALGTTARSVASKLRKEGFEVEAASAPAKAFTDAETAELRDFLEAHDGQYTYAEVAENFGGGKFTARGIQGKILSLELTDKVRATPKVAAVKTFTDEEEATVVAMATAGAFVEDIAAALNKPVASVRGKALSLLRSAKIAQIPKQREVKGAAPDALEALGDVSGKTVAEIATALEKTERGVKTMLTRRGIKVADYDGEAKHKKAAE